MDALRPRGVRIPRALKSHKSREGRLYAAYVLALIDSLGGSIPTGCWSTLREAGLLDLDLRRLQAEFEVVAARGRRVEMRRLRRQIFGGRAQLMRLEAHVREVAATSGRSDLASRFAQLHRDNDRLREAK